MIYGVLKNEWFSVKREITEIKIEMAKLEEDGPFCIEEDSDCERFYEFSPEYYFDLGYKADYETLQSKLSECKELRDLLY